MKIVMRKPKDLIGAEYNPRELTDKQYRDLKDSLQRFGFVDPILVNINPDRKDIIIGGHQRTRVAEDLKIKEVPTVEVDLTYEQERELNVRLNKNSGQWDMEALANFFETDELVEWGFDESELVGWEEEVVHLEAEEDDFEVPDEVHTDIVQGDLIEIGEHRLLCGDSTSSDDVERLMDGNKVDSVFTDPPFPNNSEIMHDMIKNIDGAFNNSRIYCNGLMLWFWDNLEFPPFSEMVTSKYIWHKTNGWQANHYECAYGFHNDEKRHEQLVFSVNNVGGENNRSDQGNHPTPKPVKLIASMIEGLANKSKSILDLFLGSGTTMIASHQLGRKCYGMELDPKYCQVIVDRMMKLDPKLEVKINGKPYKKEG